MFDFLDGIVKNFVGFTAALAVALLLVVGVLLVVRRITGRKQIVFDEWVDLRAEPDENLGRSIGAMVVHRLRSIRRVHERSSERVDISTTVNDIPAFAQSLDDEIELLGSVQLAGTAPAAITSLLTFLLQVFPFLSRSTRLSGTIHEHGGRRRLQAVLDNYRHPVTGRLGTRLWEVVAESADESTIPEDVDELAYRIYLDLLRDDAFKSWTCFRAFTEGLGHHIDHVDLGRDEDRESAQRAYRAALAIEDCNQVVSYNLGVLEYVRYDSLSSNDAAIDLFRGALTARDDALRARANSAIANALLTRVHRFGGGGRADLEEALELATQAVKLQPQLDAAVKAQGYAHHQLGEWLHHHAEEEAAVADPAEARTQSLVHRRHAREAYERALKLNPHHYVAANNMANLLLEWAKVTADDGRRRRLLAEAADAVERCLRVSPGYWHAHDNLGNIRKESGDHADALQAYRAALRFRPLYPEGGNDLAAINLDTRCPGAAADVAVRHHLEALAMTDADSVRQRKKLCDQFSSAARSLGEAGVLVDGFALAVAGTGCSCQRRPTLAER